MLRTFRAALAVAALTCAPALAHAGPVQWGYRAEAPDGTVLREMSGLTELNWSDFFLPDPKLHGNPIPDPDANSYHYTDTWRSASTVTIIDELSGCSGSLPLYLDFVQEYVIAPGGERELIYEGYESNLWPNASTFTLGGNTYRVRAPGGELHVDVTPGVTTPEPGSLALAGFGLVAVFARRLRRVRVPRGLTAAVLVCVGLFALNGTASAGPIEWDYLANFRTNGEGRLHIGTANGAEVVTFLRGEDLEAPGSGSQRIRIGSLLDIDVTTAEPTDPSSSDRWLSDLTITDRASGQVGQVSILGGGTYLGDDGLFDRKVMLELLDGDASGQRELILGNNRYLIQYSIIQGVNDRISTLVADITVSPVATPEPGTFALAGLGLGAVALRRRLLRI